MKKLMRVVLLMSAAFLLAPCQPVMGDVGVVFDEDFEDDTSEVDDVYCSRLKTPSISINAFLLSNKCIYEKL